MLAICFFRWGISVICPVTVLKLAVTIFTKLYFRTLWYNRAHCWIGHWYNKAHCWIGHWYNRKEHIVAVSLSVTLLTALPCPKLDHIEYSMPVISKCIQIGHSYFCYAFSTILREKKIAKLFQGLEARSTKTDRNWYWPSRHFCPIRLWGSV